MSTLGSRNRIHKTKQDHVSGPVTQSIHFDSDYMYVLLGDGRELQVPLILFPRLFFASPEQRERYKIGYYGDDIRWEELDEDISVPNLLLPPEQVRYFMDDLRKRVLATPELRKIYDHHKNRPIAWRYVNQTAE